MNSTRRCKGFTLIELLVVIAIIAILSAIVLANLNSAKSKARDAKRISDANQLQLVAQLYFDKCSQYPATLTTGASAGCPTGITLGTFISQIPTPPSGVSGVTTYSYVVKSDGSDFIVGIQLENATNNPILTDDFDGSVSAGWSGALNAADPVYAVTSK